MTGRGEGAGMTGNTTTSAAKQNKETWGDWVVPGYESGPLLTRDELANYMAGVGFKVSPDDLRYWEAEGVIPRSVKKWHNGATRAVYPIWMRSIIVFVRTSQENGDSLEVIGQHVRERFRKNPEYQIRSSADQSDQFIYQIPDGMNHILSQLAQAQIAEFFQKHSPEEVAYVDIKIVRKNGKSEYGDSRRLIPAVVADST